jgi:hypothetical protein
MVVNRTILSEEQAGTKIPLDIVGPKTHIETAGRGRFSDLRGISFFLGATFKT